jgi:quercetin dioxygenase-like cupin family protein
MEFTMNQGHVNAGEVINLDTLKGDMDVDSSYALVKTDDMEVIRMALPEGKEINEHSVEGEMSMLCLKGDITFTIDGNERNLNEDDWLYLQREELFSYRVNRPTLLLVTILFVGKRD